MANRTSIIQELKSARQIKAECPVCGGEFSISKAIMFDGAADLPEAAAEVILAKEVGFQQRTDQIKEEEVELRRRKHSATDGAEKKALEVNLGFVVEKIITGWASFPHSPFDCRSLFEPIDYVAFDGLTARQDVESIAFIEIKTGKGKLNKNQSRIRDAVTDGRVDYREV